METVFQIKDVKILQSKNDNLGKSFPTESFLNLLFLVCFVL